MEQLTILHEIARRQAQEGMDRALESAEQVVPKWGDIAFAWIERYARSHQRFTGWMLVKAAANDPNFPPPPTEKAWGGPIQRASRRGIIRRVGTEKDPHRHGNPIPLWESTICGMPF